MGDSIEIQVLRGIQKGRKMWIGYMKAKDLLNDTLIKVDVYDKENNPFGYQRTLSHQRAIDFQRFIEVPEMFSPSTILLNIREKDIDKLKIEGNKLVIKPGVTLWVVDGQHRIAGIRSLLENRPENEFLEMDIPVIITNVTSSYEEAILFAIFNKTQMGVKFDLVETVLNEQLKRRNDEVIKLKKMYDAAGIKIFREIETRLDANEIAKQLNDRPDNPWHNKIIAPNEDRARAFGKIIRQRSFTVSLEPLIKDMRKTMTGLTTEVITQHLIIFWSALSKIMPEAFENPKEYVLQKGTGVMVLHALYPKLLHVAVGKATPPTLNEFKEGLNRIRSHIGSDVQRNFLTSDYWRSDGRAGSVGSSKKSFNILIKEIDEILEQYATRYGD